MEYLSGMKTTRTQIAEQASISKQHFSNIVKGTRRPSWDVAKVIATVTNTTPDVWMEGTPEQKANIIDTLEG